MKYFIKAVILLFTLVATAQVKIASWNIKDMGKSKTAEQIDYMAKVVNQFDVIAIQEVVAGYGGSQAIAKLADELNRKGATWSYAISEPTESSPYSSERYAFLWKPSKLKIVGKPWLDKNYVQEIEREPYLIKLSYENKSFVLVNFHAIPKSKQPERELKYFKFFPENYKNENLIFLGDFNTSEKNTVFNPLKKMNYLPVLKNQKTSLRTKCLDSGCLASEYDNIFYNVAVFNLKASDIIHFYKDFNDLKQARKISDHVPIFVTLE